MLSSKMEACKNRILNVFQAPSEATHLSLDNDSSDMDSLGTVAKLDINEDSEDSEVSCLILCFSDLPSHNTILVVAHWT